MTRHAGRGHPVFTGEQRAKYLLLVAEGLDLRDAAAAVGVSPRAITKTAERDAVFREARDEAKAAGRAARWEGKPHDEYRYIHGGCRCTLCRKASATARAGRRTTADTASEGADTTAPIPILTLPTSSMRSDQHLPTLRAVS